jgi:hypothetical protein
MAMTASEASASASALVFMCVDVGHVDMFVQSMLERLITSAPVFLALLRSGCDVVSVCYDEVEGGG